MNSSKLNNEQSIQDFLSFCKKYFKENKPRDIDKEAFELIEIQIKKQELEKNIVFLYTRESFFYSMLNNALRKDNLLDIFELRYPIYLLNKSLNEIEVKSNPKILYRGTKYNKKEFEVLNQHIGKSFLDYC